MPSTDQVDRTNGATAGGSAALSSLSDGDTRGRIIEAATRLSAEHGFDRVSVRQITTAASANVGAITYHFGGGSCRLPGWWFSGVGSVADGSLV